MADFLIHHNSRVFDREPMDAAVPIGDDALNETILMFMKITDGTWNPGYVGDTGGPREDKAFLTNVMEEHIVNGKGKFYVCCQDGQPHMTTVVTGNGKDSLDNANAIAALVNAFPSIIARLKAAETVEVKLSRAHDSR